MFFSTTDMLFAKTKRDKTEKEILHSKYIELKIDLIIFKVIIPCSFI